MAAFVAAVVLSEVLIGTLKNVYDRTRPPGSLVATSGASFPSGHAIAASVTVVAAVIALVPPGGAEGVGRGRRGLLGRDGAIARLPWRPLAVRRRRRGSARDIVRAAGRAGVVGLQQRQVARAAAGRAGPRASPGYAPCRRTSDDGHPVAATRNGQLLPSSRYRHPGDVIRLIPGASARLVRSVASAVASPVAARPGRGRGGRPRIRDGEPGPDRHGAGGVRGRRGSGGGRHAPPPPVPAAGRAGRRHALRRPWPRPGSCSWLGGRHPDALADQSRPWFVAGQRRVPRPAADRGRGSGDRRRLALDEPGLAPGGLAHAARGGRGTAPHRHGPADGTGPRRWPPG